MRWRAACRRAGVVAAALTLGPVATAGFSPRHYHVGHSWDLGAVPDQGGEMVFPFCNSWVPTVGIGMGQFGDLYAWNQDGTYTTSQSPENWGYLTMNYMIPEDTMRQPDRIITMCVGVYQGVKDRVFTFYDDQTFTVGTPGNLGAVVAEPIAFSLPPHPDGTMRYWCDVVGIGANSVGHFYAFFSDKTVAFGKLNNKDVFVWQSPTPYKTPPNVKVGHIIDVAVAWAGDQTVAWTQDLELGAGHKNVRQQVDAVAMDALQRLALPGLGVAVSKSGRLVLEKGYGYRDIKQGLRTKYNTRGHIGSVSKVITSIAAMHLQQSAGAFDPLLCSSDFNVKDKVYEVLGQSFDTYKLMGLLRHQPIIAMAFDKDGSLYTWEASGRVSVGTPSDPAIMDAGDYAASLPLIDPNCPEKGRLAPHDVAAVAMDDGNLCWFWYDDGTYSRGSATEPESDQARVPDNTVSLPVEVDPLSGEERQYTMQHVIDADFASDGFIYVWYENGRYSAGSQTDFDADVSLNDYDLVPDCLEDYGIFESMYHTRAVAISKADDGVYMFKSNPDDPVGTQYGIVYAFDDDMACDSYFTYSISDQSWGFVEDWVAWLVDLRVDHLLSHSSGFSRSGDVTGTEWMFGVPRNKLTYTNIHEHFLATRPLLFPPGQAYAYSNHGVGLAGEVIARAATLAFGKPYTYDDYVREYVIDPLGLNIRSNSEGLTSADMARHDADKWGVPEVVVHIPPDDLGLATGGWKASAGDLVRLMLATDRDPTHPDILEPCILQLMEQKPYPGSHYTIGWETGDGKLSKGGSMTGARAFIVKYPADAFRPGSAPITVALCANRKIEGLDLIAECIAWEAELAHIPGSYDLH